MQMSGPGGAVVAGMCTVDAVYQLVGEKQTPCTRLGIAVGKDASGVMRFANIVCWRQLAERMRGAVHGDAVIAVGKIKTREYNGKSYSDLHADWRTLCPPVWGRWTSRGLWIRRTTSFLFDGGK